MLRLIPLLCLVSVSTAADCVIVRFPHYELQNCNSGACQKIKVINEGNGTIVGLLPDGNAAVITAAHVVRSDFNFPTNQVEITYYSNDNRTYVDNGVVLARRDDLYADIALISLSIPRTIEVRYTPIASFPPMPGDQVEVSMYLRGNWDHVHGSMTASNGMNIPVESGHSGAGVIHRKDQTLIGVVSASDGNWQTSKSKSRTYIVPANQLWDWVQAYNIRAPRRQESRTADEVLGAMVGSPHKGKWTLEPVPRSEPLPPSCAAPAPSKPMPATEPLPPAQPTPLPTVPATDPRLDQVIDGIAKINSRLDVLEKTTNQRIDDTCNKLNETRLRTEFLGSTIKTELKGLDGKIKEANLGQHLTTTKITEIEKSVSAVVGKLDTLKPVDGRDGKDGLNGKDGKNGADGKDAVVDYGKLAEALQQRLASDEKATPKGQPPQPAYFRINRLP